MKSQCVALLFVLGGVSIAGTHSPRVVSEHVPDTFSLKDYRNYPAWKNLNGHELALAAWKAFVGNETGVAHFQPIREGRDPIDWEYRMIRDPIKMLNLYGYGFCGAFGPTTAGFFEGLGFKQARSVAIYGANHNVTEVWYDGAWHYYDTDLRGVLFRRDGKTIASIEDVLKEPDLWTNPSKKIEPFFPEDRDLSVYARSYRAKPPGYCYRWFLGGSTMDFRLRKGESLTRWWRPQGGRWSHQEEDTQPEFFRRLINRPPYGAKTNHPNFSIWTHGNGLFEYNPTLRKGSPDFADGVFSFRNAGLAREGVDLEKDGAGEVTFEVLSPYVIVPLVGDLDDRTDDKEASVVTFAADTGVIASISLDYGRSFQQVAVAKNGTVSVDLTPYLRERYQYLVRFSRSGKRGDTLLRSLGIRTWVQVAPISLPRLKKGLNHLEYRTRDQHGFASTPWMEIPNMGSREEMSRYWMQAPVDYDSDRRTERLKGAMDLVFPAPPGRLIQWVSLGGFFHSYRGADAPRTANEIWYAAGEHGEWKRAYRAAVPEWQSHWHYAFDQDVVLDQPAAMIRVRFVGAPGVNGVRVNLHSVPASTRAEDPVKVTHNFNMAGRNVTREFVFDAPRAYTIDCPSEPEDGFVRLEVPGSVSK